MVHFLITRCDVENYDESSPSGDILEEFECSREIPLADTGVMNVWREARHDLDTNELLEIA